VKIQNELGPFMLAFGWRNGILLITGSFATRCFIKKARLIKKKNFANRFFDSAGTNEVGPPSCRSARGIKNTKVQQLYQLQACA